MAAAAATRVRSPPRHRSGGNGTPARINRVYIYMERGSPRTRVSLAKRLLTLFARTSSIAFPDDACTRCRWVLYIYIGYIYMCICEGIVKSIFLPPISRVLRRGEKGVSVIEGARIFAD